MILYNHKEHDNCCTWLNATWELSFIDVHELHVIWQIFIACHFQPTLASELNDNDLHSVQNHKQKA